MARPSAILGRFWCKMTTKMEPKSDRILTSVKLWFLLPLLCKINVFTGQKPFQNETKSLQKKALQLDPPKIASFPYGATLDGIMNRKGFQKGSQNRAPRAANLLWKSMIFGGPPPSSSPRAPGGSNSMKINDFEGSPLTLQEPQTLNFGSSSDQFWIIFSCFESIFIDLFQFCLHLLPHWFAMIIQ